MAGERQDGCLLCKIAAKEIPAGVLSETGTTLAFKESNPQAPTHIVVMPKGHYATGAELASVPETLAELMRETGKVAELTRVDKSGYRTVFNTGEHAGQKSSHAYAAIIGGRALNDMLG